MIYSVQLLTKTGLVELFEGFDNDLQCPVIEGFEDRVGRAV